MSWELGTDAGWELATHAWSASVRFAPHVPRSASSPDGATSYQLGELALTLNFFFLQSAAQPAAPACAWRTCQRLKKLIKLASWARGISSSVLSTHLVVTAVSTCRQLAANLIRPSSSPSAKHIVPNLQRWAIIDPFISKTTPL